MKEEIPSLKQTARRAGMLYLLLIVLALYVHVYVPAQLFARGDPGATAKNILAGELLFRTCIAASITGAAVLVFLSLTLYRLLKEINRHLARLMLICAVLQVPVILVLAGLKFTALMTLKGELAIDMVSDQLSPLAMLFLQLNGYAALTMGLFSSLWLIPFGMLVYRSRFIPRITGILLILAGAGYTMDSLLSILVPGYVQSILPSLIFLVTGEMTIMIWLLIKGVKDHVSIEVVSESAPTLRSRVILNGLAD